MKPFSCCCFFVQQNMSCWAVKRNRNYITKQNECRNKNKKDDSWKPKPSQSEASISNTPILSCSTGSEQLTPLPIYNRSIRSVPLEKGSILLPALLAFGIVGNRECRSSRELFRCIPTNRFRRSTFGSQNLQRRVAWRVCVCVYV